jgi:cobalt-zinc-cadmium efflux system protein
LAENHDDQHDHSGHDHGGDGHDHHAAASAGRLSLAAVLNVGFAVIQVVVGLAIGSVVVLADAAHQAVDALGLVTAVIALRVARRPATDAWSFGFGKADALGGFVSALLLLGSVAWIVVESVKRLANPEPVDGVAVIVIGVIAIVVNGGSVLLVGHRHGEEAIAVRAARLHLITDLLGSVIVVTSGVLLAAGGPDWIDPVASLILSAAVLWTTWQILASATAILLDRTPRRLSAQDVGALLEAQPGIERVHHVHLHPLGGSRVSVTAHVVVDGERSVHDAQEIVDELRQVLVVERSITHSTLQLECHPCGDGDGEKDDGTGDTLACDTLAT